MQNVTFSPFFQFFANRHSTTEEAARVTLQILCQNEQTQALLSSKNELNTLELTDLAISRIVNVKSDVDQTIHLLREARTHAERTILLGTDFSLTKTVFDHFQLLQRPFFVTSVQAHLGVGSMLPQNLMTSAHPWLIDCHHLGVQQHLDTSTAAKSPAEYRPVVHLSALQQDLPVAEPIIRQSNLLLVDLRVLGRGLLPGLSVQQLSQLLYYFGRNNRSSVLAFAGLEGSTSELTETLLWYFFFGCQHQDQPDTSRMRRYTIDRGNQLAVDFYQHEQAQKWWLQAPAHLPLSKLYPLLPCSYSDYLSCSQDEVISPRLERLLQSYQDFTEE